MTDLEQLGGPHLAALGRAHRLRQQRLAVKLRDRLRRLWRFVEASSPVASWASVSTRAVALTTAVQAEAGRGADEYVAAALSAQGAVSAPAGAVATAALAGYAADGRSLAGLLGYPAFEASALIAEGMRGDQALALAGRHLDRIVLTEVADAARTATGVAMVADQTTAGWVRMLTPPSCNRCIILAGKWYSTQHGASFARHPQCDCIAIPAAEQVEPVSPLQMFNDMTPEQRKQAGWSDADVKAIDEHGADIYQVTNAHQGRYSVTLAGQQLRATRYAAGRRSLAGQRGARIRLTVDSLYAEAQRNHWSREQLIDSLKRHGYIL